MESNSRTSDVPTQVKDQQLVARRRRQIVDAAVQLFVAKGFHRTTTREIARAAGMSIGSLYEYVSSKGDVLYLVCDAIHAEAESHIRRALENTEGGRQALVEMIRQYFGLFREVLSRLIDAGELPPIDERSLDLLAHTITVLGHMWTFRRWYLTRHYTIEDYAATQTALIFGELLGQQEERSPQ
ncbi:MAG: TetR/AcrR family transcriptional regulator [Deltaproteobacteria bacterium]|nr:TetR/AcrR family transcriptional regulator [Deltaproteobacteria bacterium]